MGFHDKGVCLKMLQNVYAVHKNEIWHTATCCSNSGISKREYYAENLSEFFFFKGILTMRTVALL